VLKQLKYKTKSKT